MAKEQAAPQWVALLEEVRDRIAPATGPGRPFVSFYPYVSTKSTIRLRGDRLFVRVSDHLMDAPEEVMRGLFTTLMARLAKVRLDAAGKDIVREYDRHVAKEDVAQRRSQSRSRRGRKHIDPVGDHRSLVESYLRVAMATDLVMPDPPVLSWSRTASRRRFGHQDDAHGVIVISRVLDDPKVPEFVLDYVVYHELLHIVHPPIQGSGGKRIIHHKAFRAAEARFPRRKEAEHWLDRLAASRSL